MSAYQAASLDALGDPTRRAIVEQLATGPKPVGELAAGLPVSRPAVSQHLKVVKGAGLVTDTPDGTRRLYRIDPRGIASVRAWLDGLWSEALQAFAEVVDAEPDDEGEAP